MYPTISDRVLRTRDRQCEFVPSENPKFVIALALLGHHLPSLVITISYVIVYIEIRKLVRTRPQDKFKKAVPSAARVGPITVAPINEDAASTSQPRHNKEPEVNEAAEDTNIDGEHTRASLSSPSTVAAANLQPATVAHQIKTTMSTSATSSGGGSINSDRERKTFVTLSYIVIAYVLCWVPFHFIYDTSFIRPDIVPQELFVALFWMTYVNSALNPFLYAFSSADVRTAFKKMIKCQFRKQN